MGFASFLRESTYKLKHSLSFRLVAGVMALALVPMLIGGTLFYYYLFDALKDSNDKYLNSTLTSQASDLDSKLKMVESTSMLIISDPEIRKVLLLMENDPAEEGTGSIVINERLKSLMLFNYAWDSRLIKSIYLITPDSKYFFITRSTSYTGTAKYLIGNLNNKNTEQQYLILPSSENKNIFLARNINDVHFFKNYATLFIEIDQESLMEKNAENSDYPATMLISKDNVIVSHTNPSAIGTAAPEAVPRAPPPGRREGATRPAPHGAARSGIARRPQRRPLERDHARCRCARAVALARRRPAHRGRRPPRAADRAAHSA
jgi:hypothetical protein